MKVHYIHVRDCTRCSIFDPIHLECMEFDDLDECKQWMRSIINNNFLKYYEMSRDLDSDISSAEIMDQLTPLIDRIGRNLGAEAIQLVDDESITASYRDGKFVMNCNDANGGNEKHIFII